MHGATKALLKSASVIALLCGSSLLPSQASAQGFNFPNIQFRVPYVGPGGPYRSHRHKVHERRSRGHREEVEEPAEREKSAPQPLSAPIKDTQPPVGGGSPPAAKPGGGEEPTFSPSR
jgi:hypothetical protein